MVEVLNLIGVLGFGDRVRNEVELREKSEDEYKGGLLYEKVEGDFTTVDNRLAIAMAILVSRERKRGERRDCVLGKSIYINI